MILLPKHSLRLGRAWREPQLAALEEQLKQVNVLGPLKQSYKMETVFLGVILQNVSMEQLADLIHDRSGRGPAGSWEHRKDLMLARLGLSEPGYFRQSPAQRHRRG